MPSPKPILLRPGESIAQAIERSVKVTCQPWTCDRGVDEHRHHPCSVERGIDVTVEPDWLQVDVTGLPEEELIEREVVRLDEAMVTCELLEVGEVNGRKVAEYHLEAEARR